MNMRHDNKPRKTNNYANWVMGQLVINQPIKEA